MTSTAASTESGTALAAKGELNRGPHLGTLSEGSPNETEPEGSVRIRKNTKEHYRTNRGQIRTQEKALPQTHTLLYSHEEFYTGQC